MKPFTLKHPASGEPARLWVSMLLALPVAALAGAASALFLWLLDVVTYMRIDNPRLLYLLPVAGLIVVWVYRRFGGEAAKGTNLVLEEVHEPKEGVSWVMAPLVLFGTLVTHLFGGSAGREGTAVQMGAGLAGGFAQIARVPKAYQRAMVLAGVAAGFGSVFGTPLAGAVFAVEFLTAGHLAYGLLPVCLLAGWVGHLTCVALGASHSFYVVKAVSLATPSLVMLVGKVLVAGVLFGLAARLFYLGFRTVPSICKRASISIWWRPVIGAAIVIALTYALKTNSYLGLGVIASDTGDVTIGSAFLPGGATPWSWLWKMLFTVATLGTGFKGGEVTPLFFIGATLGNALSPWIGAPVDLLAALGFMAVFAGASKTPLACTLMGAEVFGFSFLPWLTLACFAAYLVSGRRGIYEAQRNELKVRQ